MVRNYKRRTQQSQVPLDAIEKAILDIIACGRSIRSVANELKMNAMTLCRYIKKSKEQGTENVKNFWQRTYKPVFSATQESALKNYLKAASNVYFGLSPKEVRILAYECAESFEIKMPESWKENGSAGPDWFSGFMKRNGDLAIRTPEATSLSRATSFNKANIDLFFNKLATVMDREGFSASDIWNLDETGLTTVQKPRSVVAAKGVKQIGAITSAERGELVTMCVAVSASGNAVPPMFIFPRVKYQDHFIRDGPVDCIGASHNSGWMTHDNFLKFLEHFVKHTRASKDKKVLLLLDNHQSHIHIDILNYARDHGVVMLSFPPHCSHKLQPLDRSVFGPLKRQIAVAQDNWMRSHPGKRLTIYDLPGIVKECWPKVAITTNVVHGFNVSGIYPFNREIFCDEEFAPSSVTDAPNPTSTETNDQYSSNAQREPSFESFNIQSQTENEMRTNTETPDSSVLSSNIWEKLDSYARNSNCLIVRVPGDGHCILHAVRKSLAEEHIENISHDEICFRLKNEIIVHRRYYNEFAGERDILNDIENYFTKMEFNNETIDLVLSALCNCLGVSAILYQFIRNDVQIFALAPGRQGVVFRGDVHIARSGEDGNAHYNCVGRCFGQENGRPTNNPNEFSPEHVRPHPKAPKRVGKFKRKQRKTAISTDTPEKNNIEQEHNRREQNRCKGNTNRQEKNKSRKKAAVKKKKSTHKKTKDESSDSDSEEWFCLVCVEPYSNSKSREVWIQCCGCKNWAHEECTGVTKKNAYICQNCNSEIDSD